MNLSKYFLICALASVSANAATSVDFGEMQPDTEYEYQAMVPVMGYYTPTESGIMRCYSTGDVIAPYSDAAHQTDMTSINSYYGSNGEKVRIYNVIKDETVYFYSSLPLDGGKFRFSLGNESIEIASVSPAANGTPVSLSTNYNATIAFSIPIKCTKCTLALEDESVEITPVVNDAYITINWFNTIRQWYNQGKINDGDIIKLTITGLRDANDSSNRPDFGDGVGKLVLYFTMAAKPAELVSESGTPNSGVADFLTYYLPGSDDGIVSLTFSDMLDPDCTPVAEISYGDPDNIELGMYIENPPVRVEDKTVSVNLQGVTRFPDEMVPGLPAQPYISLRISSIKSADGQYVLTGYSSSPYSFGYSYNLKSVVYSIAADWIPAAGSSLKSGEEMEIWVLNGQKIKFDSVEFSFVKDGALAKAYVPYSDIKVENDTDSSDALLYYLSAPSIDADPDSEITVTFSGLECADGLDHSSDIFAKYKSDASAVDAIGVDVTGDVYIDLLGQRVLAPCNGIFIRNGKKIVVK